MIKFEEMLQEIEDIARRMEDKDTTLDESLELFNTGVKRSSECMNMLNESKGKAQLLVRELEGITKADLDLG